MHSLVRFLFALLILPAMALQLMAQTPAIGVPVAYELPATPGQTYLVTLAIVDAKNPDWIVSTFVAGQPRTVTDDNKGKFTETWNGLDENFMPVPPGEYGVKGIYSPAKKWDIDGQFHAIVPQFHGGASSWIPARENRLAQVPFGGDPVNAPLTDVAVGPNGVAVIYYQYLENGTNCPMFDLNKPAGYDQFIRSFASGGAGGGSSVTTDGESVWAFSTDGGPKYVYRADHGSFGSSPGANRRNSYLPEGWVTAMTCYKDTEAKKSYVYIAQRGKIVNDVESETEFIDKITVHAGNDGTILAAASLPRPMSLTVQDSQLFALHGDEKRYVISTIPLKGGLTEGEWKPVFAVPEGITPADMEVDSRGRFYLSDTNSNKVYQFDAAGKPLRSFGKLPVQKPGSYDRETLMGPTKLATWTDKDGKTRLLIVDSVGPNRISEWDGDAGSLIRDFMSHQTKCNNGYAFDPADATLAYLPGHGDWLTRFKIDYATGEWKVDAVWPNIVAAQHQGLDKPVAIRANNRLFLVSGRTLDVYRLAGDQWLRSAGLIQKGRQHFFWNDANGNGQVDDSELRLTELPGSVITYHGQNWLADLSYVAAAQHTRDIWRLAPDGFDAHGNPIFSKWQKLLTDPILAARAKKEAGALYGGTELVDTFSSDWAQVSGAVDKAIYVQARGGSFNANHGTQHKISCYVPDGKGGYRIKWRVGRTAFSAAERGEMIGAMRLFSPINGLLTIVDQSRSGLLLYTEQGLYVDTLFVSGERKDAGTYALPGEFFAGTMYADSAGGKIFYAHGKFTSLIHEMQGWSLTNNPVRALTTLQQRVNINSSQIAPPSEIALSLRGGAGKASVARFSAALGGAALDGSMTGWESAEPVQFEGGKEQKVEVRGLYDPGSLYLRWHVRMGSKFEPKSLPPLERMFTHDQATDTVGFYVQGDPHAASSAPAIGRPGDARFVFGLFSSEGKIQPAAVVLYPHWSGPRATPQVYRTPVGAASFAHVGAVPGMKLGHSLDVDGMGFVIVAAIPRSAVPMWKEPLGSALRTRVNFDANLGGHNKFWWTNTDGSASRETFDEPSEARLYPGSWAPLMFQGLEKGVAVRNWSVLGPFGGPGAEKFSDDPSQGKEGIIQFYETSKFPPDDGPLDFNAKYEGNQIKGYWKDPGHIEWQSRTIQPLDTRVVMGGGSSVWYGATWIHAPSEVDVEFLFQGSPMVTNRWFLNGEHLQLQTPPKLPDEDLTRALPKKVKLRAGWNQVYHRSLSTGYPPLRVGLVITAAEEKLWSLKLSGRPPQ